MSIVRILWKGISIVDTMHLCTLLYMKAAVQLNSQYGQGNKEIEQQENKREQ